MPTPGLISASLLSPLLLFMTLFFVCLFFFVLRSLGSTQLLLDLKGLVEAAVVMLLF
jgi:hypothetical protein